MYLKRLVMPLVMLLAASTATGQELGVDVDFLLNYYDQDGDHSPVTGGIGTEDLQVLTPVFVVKWAVSDDWSLNVDLGVDSITSASTDNIDAEFSSASRQDNRAYTSFTASRKRGEDETWRFGVSVSSEYDYTSTGAHVSWSRDFDQRNTNLTIGLRHFSDTVELYDIDGEVQGEDDRQTTELSLAMTRVLGKRTVGSAQIGFTAQSGFLSTPFHEVILADGTRVAERLPDSRQRIAASLSVNHTFSRRIVQRLSYRFYTDDWGIDAHTIEAETHFRLPTKSESWIFPILRFHTQTGSDYFGLPQSFLGDEPFFTADRDLSELDSNKFGLGWRWQREAKKTGFWSRLRSIEARVASYSRSDGLDALTISLAFGWRF